jgi:hypothetical protein
MKRRNYHLTLLAAAAVAQAGMAFAQGTDTRNANSEPQSSTNSASPTAPSHGRGYVTLTQRLRRSVGRVL